MFRNKSVDVHQFSMIPSAQIPRSSFRMENAYKTTFETGFLIPVYVEEVLPGDTVNLKMTAFTRLSTPIVPVMDNLYLESFFFFVPYRLLWVNWKKFMGEQASPGDSISYTIPQVVCPAGGWAIGDVADYMGLPTVGTTMGGAATISHSSLPLRAYNLIWQEWFRDENLVNTATINTSDGPDSNASFPLRRRGKRHDYFTACLPWTQKGTSVALPLGNSATVKTSTTELLTSTAEPMRVRVASTGSVLAGNVNQGFAPAISSAGGIATGTMGTNFSSISNSNQIYPTNLYADLSTATAATINQIRQAFQIQRLLERDARGGTRYTEIVRSHFGVISPDARLQRPEYLGGGSTPIQFQEVPQTSATGVTGGTTPAGFLSAIAKGVSMNHGFTQSFTEHGVILGMVCTRADLSYQQGLRRMWSRSTRYDFYFPVFAMLGEQAVLNKEIYAVGTPAQDDAVFGYQERWAEYRYKPSEITGLFRSTATGTLDVWHLSQNFTALPTLNSTFIADSAPVNRVLAVSPATNKQFLFDAVFSAKWARPLPMYSVPGLVDHF